MPRPNINQMRAVQDFATTYNWIFQLTKIPTGVSSPPTQEIDIRAISMAIPTLKNAPIETSVRGHKVFQSGIHSYEPNPLTLKLVEGVDSKMNAWMKAWREACWQTITGVAKKQSETEAVIKLVRLNRQDQPIWTYTIYGCFLAGYDQPEVNSENTLFQPTMQLQYQYFDDTAS
ncbi:MAG: hypothetical protein WC511_02765 [Candidatus Pacearchaeota archaeon]